MLVGALGYETSADSNCYKYTDTTHTYIVLCSDKQEG